MLRRRGRRRLEARGRLVGRAARPSRRPLRGLLRMTARLLRSIYNGCSLEKFRCNSPPMARKLRQRRRIGLPFSTLAFSAGSFLAGSLAIYFSVKAVIEKGNSDLVNIGVSVLRVDPEKEKQLSSATREWALNLIDANAGGVTLSQEAKEQLLREPLKFSTYFGGGDTKFVSDFGGWDTKPDNPAAHRPAPEPPK